MNKQEFIDGLRTALNGSVSPGLVQENVNYYEDYINTEVRKGKSEGEVLQSLGDPRLIARTIVETNKIEDKSETQQSSSYQGSGYYSSYRSSGYQEQRYSYNTTENKKHFKLPWWAWMIIVILIVGVVLSAVFSVLTFLAPVILPIIVVVFLVKLFRDWLN